MANHTTQHFRRHGFMKTYHPRRGEAMQNPVAFVARNSIGLNRSTASQLGVSIVLEGLPRLVGYLLVLQIHHDRSLIRTTQIAEISRTSLGYPSRRTNLLFFSVDCRRRALYTRSRCLRDIAYSYFIDIRRVTTHKMEA